MNTLLIFFAFPVAVIILSAIFEKLLKSPITVSAFVFAVFLVVTFAAFNETFLIATFAYTIIAFITAFIVHNLKSSEERENNICNLLEEVIKNNSENNNNENLVDTVEDLLSNTTNNSGTTSSNKCCCNYNRYRKVT